MERHYACLCKDLAKKTPTKGVINTYLNLELAKKTPTKGVINTYLNLEARREWTIRPEENGQLD